MPKKKISKVLNVDFKTPQKKKRNNITLDKTPDGRLITSLDHYKTKNLERWLSIDDCLLICPDLLKKRTWESWRSYNRDKDPNNKSHKDKLGPQYKKFGLAIYKIKVYWLSRYVKGYGWEEEQQPQSTTLNNTPPPQPALGNI